METLSWNLIAARLESGTPWALSMGGRRGVRIGFDSHGSRLYVRLPADSDLSVPAGAYSQMDLELREDHTGHVLEISTATARYFPEFHRFAGLLTEVYESEQCAASVAFHTAIGGWLDFASRRSLLTAEQQIGLFGELLVLDALLRERGGDAVDAWIGRDAAVPARHDFRIFNVDLEVKSTRSRERTHFIHGASQLAPAPGHQLYVLSLRLEPAGAGGGRSLPEQVRRIRNSTGEGRNHEPFVHKLASAHYHDEDAAYYTDRYLMADTPRLIPVDEDCPKITTDLLAREMPQSMAGRIDQLSYRVNFEGLGVAMGSPEFSAALGGLVLECE